MTRVLSVVHGNTFGGPHNRNSIVAPILEKKYGIHTTVLVPEEPGNAVDRLRSLGIDVVEVPVARLRARLDPRFHWQLVKGFSATVSAIKSVLSERKIDVVQINGVSNPHAAMAARQLGIPIVWQILDTFPPIWFRALMMPYVTRTAGAVMSTGRRVASQHPGALALSDKLIYFHPPVNVDRFTFSAEQRARAREELGLGLDDEVVGNVSNLNPQKGHRSFIRAAARVKQTRPNVKFVVLGGRYETHKAYIDGLFEEAKSLGFQLGSDLIVRDPKLRVAELSMAFDVFWMTPEPNSEGIPTAIEEAMSLGLPVVASDVGSIAEIVQHGVTGFVTAPRDTTAIGDFTLPLLLDADQRRRLGAAAARFAREHFRMEVCAERHADAYGLALGRQHGWQALSQAG